MVAALFWEMQIYTAPSCMWHVKHGEMPSYAHSMQCFSQAACVHTNHHTVNIIPAGCSFLFVQPLYSQRSDLCLDCGSDAATLHSLHMLACAALSAFTFPQPSVSTPLCTYFMHSVTSRSILVDFLPWNCSHLELFVFSPLTKAGTNTHICGLIQTISLQVCLCLFHNK